MIWAGYGEELFYRGYLHARLRAAMGRAMATLISSLLFGVRHATQLVILWPEYPWEAAGAWVLVSTIAGAGFAWLYDRSGSLAPPVVAAGAANAELAVHAISISATPAARIVVVISPPRRARSARVLHRP